LPPANINVMFARMQPVEAKAGQVIIRQGDPGDYLLRHQALFD
jgi:CRP-like cAMP-binding protein